MDPSESDMNVMMGKTDSGSPSRAEPDVSYAELHFKTLSTPQVRTDRDGLKSTYSELKFRKEEPRIAEDEDPHIYFGHGALSTTAETAAKEQDAKVKIGNRPYCLICLLCLVTSALIVIVAGLSIHLSQIRQSQITSNRNYNELNSTFQSKLSALNSNLSDLGHQLVEMRTKYRTVNETKAKICELLTSRREQTCSENWITNKGRCYYVSTFETSLYKAIQECSQRDSWLLEINSRDETSFVSRNIISSYRYYWIGKCENRNVGFGLLYKDSYEKSVCSQCDPTAVRRLYACDRHQLFICERSVSVFPDVPEKFQDLCRQPVE